MHTEAGSSRTPGIDVKYLHTMVRVRDLAASLHFYELLGLREVRRIDNPPGRYTLVFLAAPGDEDAADASDPPAASETPTASEQRESSDDD